MKYNITRIRYYDFLGCFMEEGLKVECKKSGKDEIIMKTKKIESKLWFPKWLKLVR